MATANPHKISQLGNGTLTAIADDTDFPHSGLIKGLSQMARQNIVVKNNSNDFDISQSTANSGTLTVSAGTYLRDGKKYTASYKTATTAAVFTFGASELITTYDKGYHLVVVDINNFILVRKPTVLNKVPDYTSGDTIIALFEYSSTTSSGARNIQYLTTDKVENNLSIAYGAGSAPNKVYTEVGTLQGAATGTTLDSTVGALTLTSANDITVKLGGTASSDVFSITDSADEVQLSVTGDGSVALVSGGSITIGSASLTETELEIIDGATLTTTELNYVDGVTSAIQTQLNGKAVRTGNQTLDGSVIINKDRAATVVGAEDISALHVDFDRIVPNSGTAAHNDIGIDLDVTSASKGTSTAVGMDIDVVGAATGTQTVIGLTVDVSGSNDNNYAALLNGGFVGIGNTAPVAPLHITSTTDGENLRLESTEAGGNQAPDLIFKRTSSSPVDGDNIGNIRFLGTNKNDSDNALAEHEFADIYARINDVSLNSEDGELYFRTFLGGTQTRRLDLTPTETVFNEDGVDINFRVESDDSTHMLFIDAEDDKIGINNNNPSTTLDIGGNVKMVSPSDAGTAALSIDNLDTDQEAIHIEGGNITASVLSIIADSLSTHHAIDISADSLTTGRILNLISDSAQTDGRRLVNIENDNTAATGTIPLYIKNDSTGDCIVLESTNADGGAEPSLVFNRTSASPVDGDFLGNILFKGRDSGGNAAIYGSFSSRITDTANTAEAGALFLQAMHQGGLKTFMYSSGHTTGTGSTTFNYNGVDIDFIVLGDTGTILKADASTESLGIGTATPSANVKLDVEGAIGLDELGSAPTYTANRGTLYADNADNLRFLDGANVNTPVLIGGKHSIWVPAAAMYPNTTNGCSALTQVELSNGPELKVLDFATGADDFAQFTVAFPKSWNEGTVTFQPFWTISATGTNTVAWQLAGVGFGNSDLINTAFGTAVAPAALAHSGTSGDMMVSAESGAITIAGASVDSVTYFQINRDTSADTHASDARLVGIKLFYDVVAGNDE